MSTKSAKNKPAGKVPSLISDQKLQQLYTTMLKCRILDSHAGSLHGGASWKGLEAAAVGTAIDLRAEDAIVFSSGAAVASFLKDVPLHSIFAASHKRSSHGVKKRQKNVATAAASAQGTLATGIAYAHNTGSKGSVTVAFLSGNPASSEAGRAALQFAGAHKLPIIYVYREEAVDAAQMYSYGFPVIPVDGSDVVAVYRVAYECTIRAREGGGPSVIACAFVSKSRSGAKTQDPIRNMEEYLSAKGLDKNERKESIIRAFEKAIAAAKKAPARQKTEHPSRHVFVI
jgi:TPP-dependent pyruvate/acetoin dehydrogenase alpha subunit